MPRMILLREGSIAALPVKPDNELAKDYVEKAEHNLDFFLIARKSGFYDWAVNIGFYVTYHCCLAILAKFGYDSRNQECTLALVESLVEDGKISKDFQGMWMLLALTRARIRLFRCGKSTNTRPL